MKNVYTKPIAGFTPVSVDTIHTSELPYKLNGFLKDTDKVVVRDVDAGTLFQ